MLAFHFINGLKNLGHQMSKIKINIFAYDDHAEASKKIIEKIFLYTDYEPNIDMKCPAIGTEIHPFCNDFPKANGFDKYDFAFIDIELNDDPSEKNSPFDYHPDGYEGGTIILPTLRQQAPWLPVIGYSRLYDRGEKDVKYNPLFLISASTYLFDVQIPRSQMNSDLLDHSWVDLLLKKAQFNRIKACIGDEIEFIGNVPEISFSHGLDDDLSQKLGTDINEILQIAFYFAKSIFVEPFIEGQSGSSVVKIFVTHKDELADESVWVIKFNNSPSKLHQEITAHHRMRRKGIPFAMMVPTLYQNVLFNNNVSLIGYQFASDFVPLSSHLNDLTTFNDVLKKTKDQFQAYYSNSSRARKGFINIILEYLNSNGHIGPVLSENGNTSLEKFFKSISTKNYPRILNKSINHEEMLIHGDLHLDNIMINEPLNSIIFIDFAHSCIGPKVLDISKMYVDILVRMRDSYKKSMVTWPTSNEKLKNLLEKLFSTFKFTIEDSNQIALLNFFIIYHLLDNLAYNIEDKDLSLWLKNIIAKLDIKRDIIDNCSDS